MRDIEQQKRILEAAAKACGILQHRDGGCEHLFFIGGRYVEWNPLTNSADTFSMCAKLGINSFFYEQRRKVECWIEDDGDDQVIRRYARHDGTTEGKEAAWRLAATMVAAKIGGYKE